MNPLKKVIAIVSIGVLVLLGILARSYVNGRSMLPFDVQLDEKGIAEVLLFASQALDEMPRWSTDSNFVYVNDEGIWKRIGLSAMRMSVGKWRNDSSIGIAENVAVDVVPMEDVPFEASEKVDPRKVITANGTIIELILPEDSLGVALVISRPSQSQEVIWESDLENCHSLVLSPDGKYVAYKCELNGLIVRKL